MKKKLISVNRLIDRINRDKKLTREEKFEKVIDTAFKRIYKVKEENWDNNINKVKLLVELGKKENNRAKELGIREVVDNFFTSQNQRQYN